MKDRILASVVIPTHNCAHLLRATLLGLTKQTVSPDKFEVLIADDNSCDNLNTIVNEFSKFINMYVISLHEPSSNIRLARTRNQGIVQAAGKIIVTLDVDCVPIRNWLFLHLSELRRPKVATIGLRKFLNSISDTLYEIDTVIDNYTNIPDYPSKSNYGLKIDRRLPELLDLQNHPMPFNCFHLCNTSFYKRDALEVGLIDEGFDGNWGYEDIEFGYRLWRYGVTFRFIRNAIVLHQENNLYTSKDRFNGREINFPLACKKIPGFFEFRKKLGR